MEDIASPEQYPQFVYQTENFCCLTGGVGSSKLWQNKQPQKKR